MKKLLQTLFIFVLLLSVANVNAQQWVENLPQDQIDQGEMGFFELQKAFNDYWEPRNVENGYYELNGKRIKASGWKQFKRWEWFWESRIDPKTGAFPSTSALHENQKYQEEHPQFKSGSASGNWTSMGPSTTNGGYAGLGRLNCIAFHPTDDNTIYVGAAAGGIWKSSNGGGSWNPLSDNNAVLGISDIVVLDNGSTEIIYIATGDKNAGDNYSVGVLKSTDGGISWNVTGLDWTQSNGQLINRLLVDPDNSSVLYAATSVGLLKSTNGGDSWTNNNSTNFMDIEFNPGDPSVIYGSTKTGGDIYRSQDSGSTWTLVLNSAGKRAELAVSANSPDNVYSVICNSANGLEGIYRSVDGGSSFTQLHGGSPNMLAWNCDGSDEGGQGWYDLCIAVDPNDANRVVIGGVNTWTSFDGGSNWTILNHWSSSCGGVARVVHADKHALAFQKGSSTLFECNDGGLYSLSDDGITWSHLGNGLVISQLYRLGVAQTSSTEVIGGLQDNGTKLQYGSSWYDIIGGDGMECAIDPTDINIQYGELYYGQIRRTRNLWGNYVTITGGITGNAAWVTPFVLDPSDPSVIYVGYQDVWKRDFDNDTGFHKISNWDGASLQSLAVAPSNSSVICAATSSILYRTTDGGSSWSNISPPAGSSIKYVSIDNTDPNHMWVAYGQFNSEGVFESTDGGSSWMNISSGLPALPVNCVIQNKLNTQETELYAGTDVGIYLKAGNADWVPFYEGLPNVVVTELEIYYSPENGGSMIRAATFGRGLWESELYEGTAPSSPISNFVADNTSIGPGENVQFTDMSTNIPTSWQWSFPGGTPSLSTEQHPIVSYSTAGVFDVSLTVSNEIGDNLKMVNGYISVTVEGIAFNSDPLIIGEATQDEIFSESIAVNVNYPENESLVFSKISGPTWLIVNELGSLSGIPAAVDLGLNSFTVEVKDGNGDTDRAILQIDVVNLDITHTDYCYPERMISYYEWIESVNFNGTLFPSGNNEGYLDYTFTKILADANSLVSFTLNPGYINRAAAEYWNVWIDYNGDKEFSDGEELVYSALRKKGSVSGSFTAPNTAMITRMRISLSDQAGALPCSNDLYGEVEDYTIEIVKVEPKPPVAQFTANLTAINAGEAVQFTDLSTNSPTSYFWNFGNGQTSLLQNPKVTFIDAGIYDISLTVANDAGTDMLSKTAYIEVTGYESYGSAYCEPLNINNSRDYITSVDIGGNSVVTGQGMAGYVHYDAPAIALESSQNYEVKLTPFNKRGRYCWRIWIDLNMDGDFDDADETIYAVNNLKGIASGNITVPQGLSGLTRMRIAMKKNKAPLPCEDYYNGEVEDYDIDLKTGSIRGGGFEESYDDIEMVLNIFPNPVSDILTVHTGKVPDGSFIRILNLVGQEITWQTITSDNTELNVRNYTKGIYFMVFEDQTHRIVKKFIKN